MGLLSTLPTVSSLLLHTQGVFRNLTGDEKNLITLSNLTGLSWQVEECSGTPFYETRLLPAHLREAQAAEIATLLNQTFDGKSRFVNEGCVFTSVKIPTADFAGIAAAAAAITEAASPRAAISALIKQAKTAPRKTVAATADA